MTRTQGTIDRSRERRAERDSGHSAAGPSLLELLESDLLFHMRVYLDKKGNEELPDIRLQRGIVRGLAMAIARIRLPYENQIRAKKAIEAEFIRRAKETQ